jgi:hypothetical protein
MPNQFDTPTNGIQSRRENIGGPFFAAQKELFFSLSMQEESVFAPFFG